MTTTEVTRERRASDPETFGDQPAWYKDAVIYEAHVRSFRDGNGDGIGDFKGLIEKLDYLQGLGVTALWLLPFYPSPLRDDGYDISDYRQVHPSYGNLRDFRLFLREAHRRGMRVITELVLAHTSDQHPWFQRARAARAGSNHRDFYVWSDTPDKYSEARVIFKDFESSNWTFDPVADAYFWHRFYSHQPSLNYDNPSVRRAMFDVVDFWLSMGVDGLRLDAVPYLYAREGTTCENLPETFDFLRQLRAHIDERFENRMLIAEANQWPEDAVKYMGQGDICQMAFHFPLMPRMFMAARQEDRFPMVDILAEIPSTPPQCQWALFLRNHDELTLEMVTDEERDYMYRAYAQDPQARVNVGIRRRLAPLLGNDRKLIEMMNGLLFSMPGTPIIYYGDEIGMGDNIYLGDRNAVRTPMQWNSDRNAGFSDANPQRLFLPVIIDPEYHSQAINVEAQTQNPNSLLWWMRRAIALRQRYKAFGRGSLEILLPENRKVFAFIRRLGDERILCVFNLSRHVQCAELDLSEFRGAVPVELSGNQEFPPIGDLPYFITLGSHGFFWFSLECEPEQLLAGRPSFAVPGPWTSLFEGPSGQAFESWLETYLAERRWFGQKTRTITSASIVEAVPIPSSPQGYRQRERPGPAGSRRDHSDRAARIRSGRVGALHAPRRLPRRPRRRGDEEVAARRRDGGPARAGSRRRAAGRHALARVREDHGRPPDAAPHASGSPRSDRRAPVPEPSARHRVSAQRPPCDPALGRAVQLVRAPGRPGHHEVHPALRGRGESRRRDQPLPERARTLRPCTQSRREHRVPRRRPRIGSGHGVDPGAVRPQRGRRMAVRGGCAHPRTGRRTGDARHESARRCGAVPPCRRRWRTPSTRSSVHTSNGRRCSGRRTAEMHVALAGEQRDPNFVPEPLTSLDRQALFHGARSLTRQVLRDVVSRGTTSPLVDRVLQSEDQIIERLRRLSAIRVEAFRIRCHGDYHLGQVLWTGKDFVIIDFEGEPSRSLGWRRLKRPAAFDLAGMVRSLHYAGQAAALRVNLEFGASSESGQRGRLADWLAIWHRDISAQFLNSYLELAQASPFLPSSQEDLECLLDFFRLEKAMYELGYEVNTRPTWVDVPARGILDILGSE